MTDKKSKFGIGLIVGSILGGLAAYFLHDEVEKKAKQLRKLMEEKEVDKKVKEIFGEVTEEAKELYLNAKDWLVEELSRLKEAIEHIDKEKYEKAVHNVMKRVQKETKKDLKQLDKLKNQLLKEWEKLRAK